MTVVYDSLLTALLGVLKDCVQYVDLAVKQLKTRGMVLLIGQCGAAGGHVRSGFWAVLYKFGVENDLHSSLSPSVCWWCLLHLEECAPSSYLCLAADPVGIFEPAHMASAQHTSEPHAATEG